MARYQYVGAEPRQFPTLGLVLAPELGDDGSPQPVWFETDQAVSHVDVLDEEGNPTEGIETPNNADPDPHAGLVREAATVAADEEPVAEYTLEDLTKAELVELAQDIDLHGRGDMNKAELIAALREAAQVTPEELAAAEAAIDAAVAGVGQTETEPVAGEGDDNPTEE